MCFCFVGDPSEECEDLPPRFGKNCEFRCHCLNLTEFCDKQTGRCTSGCMHGWLGESCQISKHILYSSFRIIPVCNS